MRAAAVLLAAALLAAACGGGGTGGSGGAGEVKTGGILKVAQETEINGLDPALSSLVVEREIYYNLYDSLIAIDPRLNFVPALATEWKYSDDRTLVLSLRKGVKFHDGTDFDAEAVKFNLDRYRTEPKSVRKSELASVTSVEVRDPSTAVLHLKNPDATLLAQLVDRAGMILSPTAVRQAGASLGVNPGLAGSGPFQFVEWKRDDHLTLKRNPAYWRRDKEGRQLPYLDGLLYRPTTNLDAILASLRTGEVDFAKSIAGKDVESVRTDSAILYKEIPELGFFGIELNHSVAPFNDPARAKAVALALDRRQILKNVLLDAGSVAHGPLSPASWAFDPNQKLYDKPDVEQARARGAGLTFTLKTGNTQDNIQTGQLIQAQLAKAGITANLAPQDFGKLVTETRAHQFEAALSGWSGRIDPDGNMYAWFHTGGSFNDGLYSNQKVDQLLEQARAGGDQAKRKQLYADAQRQLVEDAAYVFIYHRTVPQISSRKVRNFTIYPDGINRFAETYKG